MTVLTAAVIAIPGVASADTVASTGLMPITATVQSELQPTVTTAVGGQARSAMPVIVRINDEVSAYALSLDDAYGAVTTAPLVAVPPTQSGGAQSATEDTPGLYALATAQWLAQHGDSVGSPISNYYLELAAEQLAIWSVGNALPIERGTVTDALVAERARQLVALSPSSYDFEQPTAVDETLYVRQATANQVQVGVDLTDQSEDTFDNPQKLDVRYAGQWVVAHTGEASDLFIKRGKLRIKVVGQAPDDNTAYIAVPRTDNTSQLQVFWNLSLGAGMVLVPGNGGQSAPLITMDPVNLQFPETITLDPSDFPSLTGLVEDQVLVWLSHLSGWQAIVLAIVALYVASNFGSLVNAGVTGSVSAIKTRRAKNKKQAEEAKPKHAAPGATAPAS
jgi:hypothetical protein